MATIALPRPVVPHRSSSGLSALTAPLSLDTLSPPPSQASAGMGTGPVPNKHIPFCPPGPVPTQDRNTPPPSPARDDVCEARPSLLFPPDNYTRLARDDLAIYSISAKELAAAVNYAATQPLPEPSQLFPWLHGLHPSNHIQQAFFVARRRVLRKTPTCFRGLTVVKADGDLSRARLKGAVSPQELLKGGSVGEFLDIDPKDGFSVRNFQIQTVKSALLSDIVIYGDDASKVKAIGWEIASAQDKWRQEHEHQGSEVPIFNTFICLNSFKEFEEMHPEIVTLSSDGMFTNSVVDFFHQERAEMYEMTRATEISHNVWLGPTPEVGSEDEEQFDILIECSDLGRLNPALLQTIAEGPTDDTTRVYLDFPSSGSILPPTWSHAEADGILDTCKWIWHLSHGTLPAKADMDGDGDSHMSDESDGTIETHRPYKILLHCADGYTESTMLGIAYYSYSSGQAVPEAWLKLHTEKKRNFFAYPTDVALLTALATRLLSESPACAHKSLTEITAQIQDEPRWLASLDGSLPSRILDYMYLGNLGHANNPDLLRAMGIGQILSVGETTMWREGELEKWGADNVQLVQNVQDNGIDPLTAEFERCLEFIDRGRRNGTATLVHCRVGVSRSATICIAEVMRAMNLSFPRAYCFVRARRLNVIIQPHLRFAFELLKWEEKLQLQSVDDAKGQGIKRELEWADIAREIALMNRPYAR
ncbi:dual specificity phosphatase [Microdochium bolleyi]|uniref:Dual specificity phosphatase n=1 Tax=Microdochium bolleyi TaxID=196109 RepID=A0A136IXH9_9PEZI|nr:dual specificity phosphatase [Microdochium bolleyi]